MESKSECAGRERRSRIERKNIPRSMKYSSGGEGFELDLACFGRRGDERSRQRDPQPLTEDQTIVTFEFPDRSIVESNFQIGQTVEVLKAYLETEFQVDMNGVDLEYNYEIMLDPLSLSDFINSPEDGLYIYVRIDSERWEMESKGKK